MRSLIRKILLLLCCLVLICGTALAYTTLEKGDRGADVLHMQQALSALGYTVTADGTFGAATKSIVEDFQRDHGLKVDGKAGNETLTLLYTLLAQLEQVQASVATATPQPAAPASTSQQTAIVSCADGGKLNLRVGAGTGYKVIAKIPTGTVINVLTRGSKWCNVSYNGETGYVMTSFLVFSSNPIVTPTPASGSETAIVSCDDGGKLNLRQTANSGAKILARIPNGTVLSVQRVSSKWCSTSYNGESGYVMSSFLQFGASVVTPTPVPAPTQPIIPVTPTAVPDGLLTAVVTCDDGGKLNLRERMASGAKILDRIPTGTVLAVRRVDSKWCSVTYNGQSGYVMSKFLTFSSYAPTVQPATPTPTPASGVTIAFVSCKNGGKLNLREGAGTGYKILYQIPNGSQLTVLQRGTKWSYVQYGEHVGYVDNNFLLFSTSTVTATPVITPIPTVKPTATIVPGGNVSSLKYEEFRYGIVQTTNGSLNIRKGPGTSYGKAGEVRDGTQLVVRAIEGDWCAVYYGDVEGWVMKQYLVIAGPSGNSGNTSYDTSILTRTLRGDETGDDVILVQNRLVGLGYLTSATGTYDAATIAAVKSFQRQHGLTVDGKCGPNTYALLFSDGAMEYSTSSETYSSWWMDYDGNTSTEKTAAVLRAQKALRALNYNVPLTGAFEARTHDAIVAFQLRNGITASGVLDSATQTRLYSGSAHDVAWASRYYLPEGAGTGTARPENVQLLHWANEVKGLLSGVSAVRAYDPETGLSWSLTILSRGRHLDVQPTSLEDTLIQKKSFGGTSWDIHPVYILLPDGRWSLATMHDYPHGTNTIMNNGFGGQNCVHFLRDMSEAQANDPSYGVRNQETLRDAWYQMTGVHVN